MYFEIIGPVTDVETIAAGRSIRQLSRLRRQHSQGRWRKLKSIATVRIISGDLRRAEIHWYEAQGIGCVRHKIKRFLERAMPTREKGFVICVENRGAVDL